MLDDSEPVDYRPDLLPVYTAEHLKLVTTMAELGGVAQYADLAVLGQREVAAACRDASSCGTGAGSTSTLGWGIIDAPRSC